MEKKEIPRVLPAPARPVAFIADNTRLKRKRDVSKVAGGFPNSHSFLGFFCLRITVGLLGVCLK